MFYIFAIGAASLYAEEKTSRKETQVVCECLEPGMGLPKDQKCFPAAYNAPANIDLRSCWDMNVYGGFLYWHISQEGMETAIQSPSTDSGGTLVQAGFDYHPGFNIGIGVNLDYDNWTGFLEYTWMHGNTNHHITTDSSNLLQPRNWQIGSSTIDETTSSLSSKWTMNLDQLDLAISRPFYQSERLTVRPFGGLRGLWIRQKINVDATPYEYKGRSASWAVGPMIGANTNWLLDCGFRVEGKVGGSLVYTKYSIIAQSEITNNGFFSSKVENLGFVRPTANLGTGLGWGTYTPCNKYYFDLAARYDFNILWSQNMMAYFVSSMNGFLGSAPDLYLHGLTLNMRLDF